MRAKVTNHKFVMKVTAYRDLTGGREHTTEYTDDVSWGCAPETRIILGTRVTPMKSIKKGKSHHFA